MSKYGVTGGIEEYCRHLMIAKRRGVDLFQSDETGKKLWVLSIHNSSYWIWACKTKNCVQQFAKEMGLRIRS